MVDYYETNIYPVEKLVLEKNTDKYNFSFDKEVINAFQEKNNFPREIPKPVNLSELTKYYSIIWRKKSKIKNKENKNINNLGNNNSFN